MRASFYEHGCGLRRIGWKACVAGALLLAVFSVPLCRGGDAISTPDDDDFDAAAFAELAEGFRKHCVRVHVYGKSHDGKVPGVGEFGSDMANERPTPLGGYWWDERHVIVEDPVLQDHFIQSVEIEQPFSNARYPARIAGRLVTIPAIVIEVLPDDGGLLPRAFPLEFEEASDDAGQFVLSYGWTDGEWRIEAGELLGGVSFSDSGTTTITFGASGVVISKDGSPLGLAFGETTAIGDNLDHWLGVNVCSAPYLTLAEADEFNRGLRQKLSESVLPVRFGLRVKVDDDDGWVAIDDGQGADVSEVRATGLAVGGRRLFVPLALGTEAIARIEDITVTLPDNRPLAARFVGAFREYKAVLVEVDDDLPFGELPPGFALLNPLSLPPEAFEDAEDNSPLVQEYFHRWKVDHSLGRRREAVDYDRWLGTFRGYRGDSVVLTRTNEEDGAMAFDVDGRLVAISLTPRVMGGRESGGMSREASPGFRPLDFVRRRFHNTDVFDPAMAPVEEERGRRLIDLGVEYQALDNNSSRLFHASRETRGGGIGMLVTHVYPGSVAERLGVREHDILLRLFLEGEREPIELQANDYGSAVGFDFDDISSESIQRLLGFIPPPWPSRENNLSRLLTAAGMGRNAVLEYLREGEILRGAFVTEYSVPDYRNVSKENLPRLGLTVKPITYEVARYFNRSEKSGVIVSKAEEGGKGSVAGLHAYVFIIRVDGRAVSGMEDFLKSVEAFEKGEAAEVELMVETFGKTRLVKIEQGVASK